MLSQLQFDRRAQAWVRLPAGALFLASRVRRADIRRCRGTSDDFCRLRRTSLDDYLVNLVSASAGCWVSATCAMIRFPRWKKNNPSGDSATWPWPRGFAAWWHQPQARSKLLACCSSARKTAAIHSPELRLLLALGHQIGMAVENSYLIQQTSRRSEELHVLTKSGAR